MSKRALNSKPVFIVEDDPLYGKLLKGFLQNTFPELKDVRVFPVGEESLADLPDGPQVIIVDYFLNSRIADADNGLEIIRRVKARVPDVPIIVLSGQDKPGVILEAILGHNCVYVQKDGDAFAHIEHLLKERLFKKDLASA